MEILRIISNFILSDDKTFQEDDFQIAQDICKRAEDELVIFKNSIEYNNLTKIINIKSDSGKVFINSYGIHHRDFDEMSFSIGGHPTATLFPILLAYNKKQEMGIFLQALKLEIALGKIFNPELYQSQYHPTTVIGLLGATSLTAKILQLTYNQTINALGISFSFLSGVRGNFGSSSKSLQVAHSTQHGLLSALFSRNGFTSNTDLLDRDNVLDFFVGKEIKTSHIDTFNRLLNNHIVLKDEFLIKKYNVCGSFHNIIDMALNDRDTFIKHIDQIHKVVLSMHPERLVYKNISFPTNASQKKFSPTYLYAYTFLGNNLQLITCSDEVEQSVITFMKKIVLHPKTTMGRWEYNSEVIIKDKQWK